MNLLNDCSEEEQDKAMDPNRKRSTSNLSALRNCTVQAMSNLLNANIDSGLMHSIGKFNPKDRHFLGGSENFVSVAYNNLHYRLDSFMQANNMDPDQTVPKGAV